MAPPHIEKEELETFGVGGANPDPKRPLTVQEAGRRGGTATAEKYGHDFYREIGKKGGARRATAADVRSGEMGRLGAEARWGREAESRTYIAQRVTGRAAFPHDEQDSR